MSKELRHVPTTGDTGPATPAPKRGSETGGGAKESSSRCRARFRIPSRERCLAALASIPELVAMGILSPSQANAMIKLYTTIVQEHHRAQGTASGPVRGSRWPS